MGALFNLNQTGHYSTINTQQCNGSELTTLTVSNSNRKYLPLQFTSVSITLGSGFVLLLFEHIVDSNLVTVKLSCSGHELSLEPAEISIKYSSVNLL